MKCPKYTLRLLGLAMLLGAPVGLAAHHTDDESAMTVTGSDGVMLGMTVLERFDRPWAMTFLPDGRALVTEKAGTLWLLGADLTKAGRVDGLPTITMQGQGGLGDVIVHPDFATNGTVFVSYVERDPNDDSLSGAAVVRATLTLRRDGGTLSNKAIIWRQSPKVLGNGHYAHRLALAPDGTLFITSGERQKFTPAQNLAMNLGKIVRINQDGSVPRDNPFFGNGAITEQIWTLGHRNPLGIAFDANGQLWAHEMGPAGGDELNRIVRGENYGYPLVSQGEHYSGEKIPSHESNPIYENPAAWWTPVISPAGLVIYDGDVFADWKTHALIGGLSSQALIRVTFEEAPADNLGQAPRASLTETIAREAARYSWDKRIREVEQGPDGALYVLEDGEDSRLIRLTPAN